MNRRAFFRACGVVLAAPIAALATRFDQPIDIARATYEPWQPVGDYRVGYCDSFANLRRAMREIHAQCRAQWDSRDPFSQHFALDLS
jgi:hypothetical protein